MRRKIRVIFSIKMCVLFLTKSLLKKEYLTSKKHPDREGTKSEETLDTIFFREF